ncbi:MAG: enoyl-CoA hydratase-related protein, partial [Promethearchaeota archaeon]
MDLETILFTKEKNIALIKFNRPKILNAINFRVMEELNHVIDECAKDDEIHAVIITGEGKAFAAGADLQELAKCGVQEAKAASQRGIDVFRKIELLNKPVIAAINGFALGGGCELAMACDIRIASEKAKFGQPEIKLGIIPGFGGTQRLTRLIGRGRSKLLNFTGDMINAVEAQQYGLVDKLVTPEELMVYCISLGAK